MSKGIYHVPVLLQEVIQGLQIEPAGTYVDCTFGGGGHSAAILKELDSHGRIIAFDQDQDAAANLPKDDRLVFVPHNFRHLQRFLRFHKISKVDGILADLGVSSHQFDTPVRGFSTRFNAAMDMRMSTSEKTTAASVLETFTAEKLQRLFEQYGEVTNAKTLAKLIVDTRRSQSLKTINEFRNALYPVVKGNPEKYFAQVFQALRIEVNDELGALKEMLIQAPGVLHAGARIAVITFHSLEDRLVKNFFKNGNFEEEQENGLYGTASKSDLQVITKKPVVAGVQEIKNNPRSRSAKLRIAEKRKVSEN
jgi:16S rRNA (cytosine1402-N4)-methyltransferase